MGTENQLAVLKFFELMDTIYQVKNGHVESLKVTPNLLDLCCKQYYQKAKSSLARRNAFHSRQQTLIIRRRPNTILRARSM